MTDDTKLNADYFTFRAPKLIAQCKLFGNDCVVLTFDETGDIPNRWVRFWGSFFLNSKWTFYTEDNS